MLHLSASGVKPSSFSCWNLCHQGRCFFALGRGGVAVWHYETLLSSRICRINPYELDINLILRNLGGNFSIGENSLRQSKSSSNMFKTQHTHESTSIIFDPVAYQRLASEKSLRQASAVWKRSKIWWVCLQVEIIPNVLRLPLSIPYISMDGLRCSITLDAVSKCWVLVVTFHLLMIMLRLAQRWGHRSAHLKSLRNSFYSAAAHLESDCLSFFTICDEQVLSTPLFPTDLCNISTPEFKTLRCYLFLSHVPPPFLGQVLGYDLDWRKYSMPCTNEFRPASECAV